MWVDFWKILSDLLAIRQNMFWLVLKQIRTHLKCQNMQVGARDNWRVGPSPLWEIKMSKTFSNDTNSQYHFRLALIWSAEHLKNKAPGAIFVSFSEIKPSSKTKEGQCPQPNLWPLLKSTPPPTDPSVLKLYSSTTPYSLNVCCFPQYFPLCKAIVDPKIKICLRLTIRPSMM